MDLYKSESTCYEYFKDNNIANRNELRKSLKTNPIKDVNYSFVEAMFSNYQKENKEKKKEESVIKDIRKVMCINDLHIPMQDERACKIAFKVMELEQPDELVLAGDIIDCYWESTFIKDPGEKKFLQDECDEFYRIFRKIRRDFSKLKIVYILGNHERRIKSQTKNNVAFYGVKSLEIPELLRFKELNIIYEPIKYEIDQFIFYHGKDNCSRFSSFNAKKELETHPAKCGMSGHCHRMGKYHFTYEGKTFSWYENGCLCRRDAEYVTDKNPNWQQGFSIIHFCKDGPSFVYNMKIEDYHLDYFGKIIKA